MILPRSRSSAYLCALVALFALLLGTAISLHAAEPHGVIAGFDATDGRVLLGELNCTACHQQENLTQPLLSKQPPHLAEVGSRISPNYLREFLAKPHELKPGTTMPDVLHSLPAAEKTKAIDELTHYLATLGGPLEASRSFASESQIARGNELYHTVGCVACHEPYGSPPAHKSDIPVDLDPEELAALKLPGTAAPRASVPHGNLAAKTTVDQLAKFLLDPLDVRPSGRMPNFNLTEEEATAIAAYLLRDLHAPQPGVNFTLYRYFGEKFPGFDNTKDLVIVGEAIAATIDNTLPPGILGLNQEKARETLALRWRGTLEIPTEGSYKFALESTGGAVLKIGDMAGKTTINDDKPHALEKKEQKLDLKAGKQPIEVTLAGLSDLAKFKLLWQPPGEKNWQPLPASALQAAFSSMIPRGHEAFQVDRDKAIAGSRLFVSLGCAKCHQTTATTTTASTDGKKENNKLAKVPKPKIEFPTVPADLQPKPAPKLSEVAAKPISGCLAATPVAGAPKYDLTAKQRESIGKMLSTILAANEKPSPAERVDYLLSSMNCYACHARDGKGGPDSNRQAFFVYQVLAELGDEGRLPPHLNEVGAKLTATGFDDLLTGSGTAGNKNKPKYRYYMATRMPNFGKANVEPLVELFKRADVGKVPAHAPLEYNQARSNDGRRLVGKQGLVCINCHGWNGQRLTGAEAVDLAISAKRLNADYFHALLADPQKYRPRTRMPQAWPGGKSAFSEIQEGDMDRQIDTIWVYLNSSGAETPIGLEKGQKLLALANEPVVFRTFLNKVSAHAVLVGYPAGTHYAFDANRVRGVLAWRGNFIGTNQTWDGRAGQYEPLPSDDIAFLPEAPPLAELTSLNDPWPTDLPRGGKKEAGAARTPPGWKFRGYQFDAQRVPTFLYEIGETSIAETAKPTGSGTKLGLTREFTLSATNPPDKLHLLAAAGKKIELREGQYLVDGRHKIRIQGDCGEPIIRDAKSGRELIVPIQFPGGTGQREATVKLELNW